MENNEIYIDGVNVAGCRHYDDGICCNDDVLTLSCEKTNCMYKQLKRLEQENKELKEQAQLDGECIDKLIEARDMYANALEEIREMCNKHLDAKEICYATQVIDKIDEVLK